MSIREGQLLVCSMLLQLFVAVLFVEKIMCQVKRLIVLVFLFSKMNYFLGLSKAGQHNFVCHILVGDDYYHHESAGKFYKSLLDK